MPSRTVALLLGLQLLTLLWLGGLSWVLRNRRKARLPREDLRARLAWLELQVDRLESERWAEALEPAPRQNPARH
jgi:hypothetical protein